MTGCSVIITTTDSDVVSKEIARELVKLRLAKCVQIDKVSSVYEWMDEIEECQEYRLMIKAPNEHLKAIEKKVVELHNYDLPQIIILDIQGGLAEYINWLKKSA
jgi:periplasmic divalent cation tolerance protein